ncbi:MAG: SCO family protein [Alphaproteobacteria bacterium]
MLMRRALVLLSIAASLSACRPVAPKVDYSTSGIGGPFQLTDTRGAQVNESLLAGKWSAVYFGYTYCPDVCPTTLQALRAGLDKLGPKGKQIQSILISVDPAHDDVEAMKVYVDNPSFPQGLIGLTGTPDQIAAVTKAYKIFYQKTADGLVQHQSIIYLMDPKGQLARPLTGDLTPDQIAAQIGDALRQSG